MVGILLALLLQDPSALIDQLQDDDIAVRDSATLALDALGDAALPILKAARFTCRDAQLRAQRIVDRIELAARLAKIQGGEPVAGIRATLRMDRDTVKAGEPLTLTLELTNVSNGEIDVEPPDRFDLKLPHLESACGGRACVRVTGLVREEQSKVEELQKCLGGIEKFHKALAPGKSLTRELLVVGGEERVREAQTTEKESVRSIGLRPGTYDVQIIYYAQSRKLLRGADEDLKSNVVRIKVD